MWPIMPAAEAQESAPSTGSTSGTIDYSMGVGEVTGPLGVVLAVVLALDRFGLLRRGRDLVQTDGGQPPGAVAKHREEFVELKKDVEHLAERVTEDRRAAARHREQVAHTLAELHTTIRSALED